jgi:hypothetical protein
VNRPNKLAYLWWADCIRMALIPTDIRPSDSIPIIPTGLAGDTIPTALLIPIAYLKLAKVAPDRLG